MLKELNRRYAGKKVSISVPATRTETLTPELIEQVKQVRKTGFTIAPEAGSERMRRVINKGNKVEDLLQACRNAFGAGYELIKFYYLCGLPFERDEDLVGVADETYQALKIGLEHTKRVHINVSVSSLVPKPFTPFQWVAQPTREENRRKLNLVKHNLSDKRLKFKCHDERMSLVEGLFARGDRRLSQVLHAAFRNGCRFDEWSEHLRYDLWEKTFTETSVDLDFYVHRERSRDEVLPWDHLFIQMRKEWLWNEFEAARNAAFVEDCSVGKCVQFCGVCDFKSIKNKSYVVDEREIAAKKGNREWYGRFSGEVHPESPKVVKNQIVSGGLSKKLRATFVKKDMAALMGHLELMNVLKRAILRTGADVAYSEGFHPQMKLSMGGALPLGMESECEQFDLVVRGALELEDFCQRLNVALPDGLRVIGSGWIDLHAPSIYSRLKSMMYEVEFSGSARTGVLPALERGIADFVAGRDFVYTRSNSRQDMHKPERVFSLNRLVRIDPVPQGDGVRFTTLVEQSATVKPVEVLAALSGHGPETFSGVRIKKVAVEFF